MYVFIAIALTIAVVIALNQTALFHRSGADYAVPEETRLFDPRAASVRRETGSDACVLFVHGFPETPAIYVPFCERAAHAGYDAFAPLLPGCGTEPRDALDVRFEGSYAFIRERYLELRARYRRVFLVGTSYGALICLRLCEEFSPKTGAAELAPDAVASIAAPIFLNSLVRHRSFVNLMLYVVRFVGWFKPMLGVALPDPERVGRDGDERWVGYLGLYPRVIYDMTMAARKIERNLGLVTAPICVLNAREDRMTPFACALTIVRRVSSGIIRLYAANMSDQRHARHSLLLYDSQREKAWSEISRLFDETRAGKLS